MVRFCLSANEVLNKVRVRIALNYLLNRADALGQAIARSEPSYRNYFSTIVGYSGLHGNSTEAILPRRVPLNLRGTSRRQV
jgi:hypothetical protein